jgi:hypothetical protein
VKPVQHGYSVPDYRPPPDVHHSEINGPTCGSALEEGQRSHPGPPLSAVQQRKVVAVLEPHLQILCGPMLRYDTVKDGTWHGAVMIVSESVYSSNLSCCLTLVLKANDSESIYNPFPTLMVEWEAENDMPFTLDETPLESEDAGVSNDNQAMLGSDGNPLSAQYDVAPAPPPKSTSSSESDEDSSSLSGTEPEEADPSTRSRFGTWASSVTKKLKGLKPPTGKGDFSGRPPERIAKTERIQREKQRWATKRVVEVRPDLYAMGTD